jgi:hypothetical protein
MDSRKVLGPQKKITSSSVLFNFTDLATGGPSPKMQVYVRKYFVFLNQRK